MTLEVYKNVEAKASGVVKLKVPWDVRNRHGERSATPVINIISVFATCTKT